MIFSILRNGLPRQPVFYDLRPARVTLEQASTFEIELVFTVHIIACRGDHNVFEENLQACHVVVRNIGYRFSF